MCLAFFKSNTEGGAPSRRKCPAAWGQAVSKLLNNFGILQLIAQDDVHSTGRNLVVDVETVCQ